jgi:hypothetical protein
MSHATMPVIMARCLKNLHGSTTFAIRRNFCGVSAKSSWLPFCFFTTLLTLCLVAKRILSILEPKSLSAHTVNHRITVHMIQKHTNPTHQIEASVMRLGSYAQYVLRCACGCHEYFILLTHQQERSSAKRKELYKSVQVKAAVSPTMQPLLDMKVQWSSTYVMVNRAEGNQKASYDQ